MTILSSATIPVIEDRIRLFGTVTLSAETCHEILHRAARSYRQEILLEQIAKGDGDAARWARRSIDDEKRDRPKLKYPSRLVTIEVA